MSEPVVHPTLYKRDSVGKVRVWRVETSGDQYRVVAGIKDGNLVENDWKTAVPKNVGKANETTGEEQALSEKDSLYERQLKQGKYHESEDDIDEEGYFEPMLAEKWNDPKDKRVGIKAIEKAFASGKWVFVQPKLDGIRNIAVKDRMHSREGEERVSCPHVFEQLKPVFEEFPELVFDGELYNHEYHDNFNKLQSLILQKKPGDDEIAESAEKVQYHIYDVFSKDMPEIPFSARHQTLTDLIESGPILKVVETVQVNSMDEIDEFYGRKLEEGYEGIVIRIDDPYENKRSRSLIKRKEFFDEEFEVVEIIEGTGNWNGKAKAVKFKYGTEGNTTEAGIRGNEAEMAELLRKKDRYVGGDVTVRFPNKTPAGKPRFGVATAFYEGKRKD